jgi:tetratricopeptide (TPR) repeat protein
LVLTVHMAALAAVLAHDQHQPAPADPAEVSAFLLTRERDHWEAMHALARGNPLATAPDAMSQAVYTATLTGPLTHTDATTAVRRIGIESALHPGQIIKDHAICYPPTPRSGLADRDPGSTVLEPLYPDRLGEDFLALTTPGHTCDHPTDPWTQAAPARLLSADPGSDQSIPVWTRPALTVLIETARRWPHIAHRQLYPLLAAHPDLALTAGSAALTTLAALPDITPELLLAIEAHFPKDRHVDLDTGIAALTTRLTHHRLTRTDDPAAHAYFQNDLGIRLANAGLLHQAHTAAEQAVMTYQRLAITEPGVFDLDLARSLNNLGARLLELGRQEEALTAIEQAVATYRRLAATMPSEFDIEVTTSLISLGASLFELGRGEEALTATEQAVATYRRLAATNPAFDPDLAKSPWAGTRIRINLHIDLGAVLGLIKESVANYRRRAARSPSRFRR